MGITDGCTEVGMSEENLDLPETQTSLKQMCGIAVSQGMDGDFFLMPQSATTCFMAC